MRIRSEFNPNRLTSARECRGMTLKALAREIGMTDRAVMNYERGDSVPLDVAIDAMARALAFPTDFFFGDALDDIPESAISFRARRALTSKVRNMTIGRSKLASTILSSAIGHRFNLPQSEVPTLSELRSNPEAAAKLVRSNWRLANGPIKNMVHLLEKKGVQIY